MSMQALNQLVARSITDPGVLRAFQAGQIGEVLQDLEFGHELREKLAALRAASFAEFAVLAYRVVKTAEQEQARPPFPSPLEGLIEETKDGDSAEQAA